MKDNRVFINFSNHPSAKWSQSQLEKAGEYGEVIDVPFPNVDPDGDEEYIEKLAGECVERIDEAAKGREPIVHVMGEMTLIFSLVKKLCAKGMVCVSSTTQRLVVENPDGSKTATFSFVRFREYR